MSEPPWHVEFPRVLLRVDGRVQVAAERCGVTARAAYKRRRHDPAFAAAWADAERKLHRLRGTAIHRREALLAAMVDGDVVLGALPETRYTLRVECAMEERDA